ncbi:MAG: hypothetical protein LQ348_005435 [Seirophora lacunosa]|nr:MAG: hypothetical protein LQ348_005435 [Seirophora lacunosa]
MTFQDWLVKGEEDGLWQCGVYEHDIHLIAGYDRGESGRTELLSAEPDTGSKQTAAKKEEQRKKRRQKKTSSKKNLTDKVVAGPLVIRRSRMAWRQVLQVVRSREMEEMPEARRGKQRVVIDVKADAPGGER